MTRRYMATSEDDHDWDEENDNEQLPGANAGTLWFSIYPVQTHWLDLRKLIPRRRHEEMIQNLFSPFPGIKYRIKSDPDLRDGGTFVRDGGVLVDVLSSGDLTLGMLSQKIRDHIKQERLRAPFSTQLLSVHRVRGIPFVHDIRNRYASNKLRVEMKGPAGTEVGPEKLFTEFRRYGQITDMSLSPSSKDGVRTASVQYTRTSAAAAALNCLHRSQITDEFYTPAPSTTTTTTTAAASLPMMMLYLSYEPFLQSSAFSDVFAKHPRIMIPLAALLFTAGTILVFDPLRSFFIHNKVTDRFALSDSTVESLNSLKARFRKLLRSSGLLRFLGGGGRHAAGSRSEVAGLSWESRRADEELVKKWLREPTGRVLFVTGSKGSGQQQLLEKVVRGRPNVVAIDFAHMVDRPDEDFMNAFSKAVGFFPGFSFVGWLSSMMDVFTPGAAKAADRSVSMQVTKVLECMTTALEQIRRNLDRRGRQQQQQSQQLQQQQQQNKAGESDIAPSSDDIPLFVISGFNQENRQKKDSFFNVFLQWAAEASEKGLLRLALVSEPSFAENVTQTMPDVKSCTVALNDAPLDSALEFVTRSLHQGGERAEDDDDDDEYEDSKMTTSAAAAGQQTVQSKDGAGAAAAAGSGGVGPATAATITAPDEETVRAVSILGGRYADLVTLVRLMEGGTAAREAVEEIVSGAVQTARTLLLSPTEELAKQAKWKQVQLWQVLVMLAESPVGQAGYDHVLFNVFKGDEGALRALVRVDLLRVVSGGHGRSHFLKAGSPVMLEAFRRMARDGKLRPGMDLQVLKWQIDVEQSKITAAEEELGRMAQFSGSVGGVDGAPTHAYPVLPKGLADRKQFLEAAIQEAHKKIALFDTDRRIAEQLIKDTRSSL